MRRTSLVLAVLGLALSSCVVVEDGPGPRPPYPEPPHNFCPRDYRPVCAARAGERATFPNRCEAERSNFSVLYGGSCDTREPGLPRPPRPDRPPRPGRPDRPIACPEVYIPVCARKDGIIRTFPSSCVAGASGFRIVASGPC